MIPATRMGLGSLENHLKKVLKLLVRLSEVNVLTALRWQAKLGPSGHGHTPLRSAEPRTDCCTFQTGQTSSETRPSTSRRSLSRPIQVRAEASDRRPQRKRSTSVQLL